MVIQLTNNPEGNENPVEPYFGISFCGDTSTEAKMLIDKTKDYTNLFVLQSGPISKNETATNEICDYAVDAGLDVIVFFGWFDPDYPWQIPWLDYAKARWGEDFLGLYLFDEPGGIQIDYNWTYLFHHIKEVAPEFYQTIEAYIQESADQTVARDYEEATERYLEYLMRHIQLDELINRSITSFTSDYALYWFDYLSGYDTIFVQIGWEHNLQKHIGLCRGAANVQQKDWGTIIVWNDRNPDLKINNGTYKTGPEMLYDMHVSYEAGADYIIIFNYPTDPPGNPYGILTDEHFEAMQKFWNYMQNNPEEYGKTTAQAALVLPENYGWGMRRIDDRMWGYWGPDEKAQQIWTLYHKLLVKYSYALDIVYDDPNFPLEDTYQEIYYWNYTG
ncbi:MAG: hypothetical protein CW716_09375 [Candidatus Bathyarchaeum sp.]|nr:MAG: hypothetical protein CW716_09375 [Candidatus Bathyarchaeum sp.]